MTLQDSPPDPFRTAEQLDGLQVVADIVTAAHCDCVTVNNSPADMVVLAAYHRPSKSYGPTEVVYDWGDGVYDLWVDHKPLAFDLSAEQAAAVVIRDYRSSKFRFVMSDSQN